MVRKWRPRRIRDHSRDTFMTRYLALAPSHRGNRMEINTNKDRTHKSKHTRKGVLSA